MGRRKKTISFLVLLPGKVTKLNKISLRLKVRLERALKLFRSGEFSFFLVSGGKLNPPEIQNKSTALLMKEWLMEKGIDRERILVEDDSSDIFQNLENIKDKIKKKVAKSNKICDTSYSVTVVDDKERLKRIAIVFENKKVEVNYIEAYYKLSLVEFLKEKFYYVITVLNPHGADFLNRSMREKKY